MSLPTLLRVPILALAVVSAGCVTTTRTPVDEGSGFGLSYDSMYTMSGDMIVWSRATARETLYEQILLDPPLPRFSDARTGELVAAAISAKDASLNELALSGQLDGGDLVRAVRPMIERVRIALDSPVRRE